MGKRLTVSNGDIRDDGCSHTYARYEPVGEGDAILVCRHCNEVCR